jgi:hypothetical protein
LLVTLVLLLWLGNLLLLPRFFKDEQSRGQFGDQFGSVNALFSGLAFAGLISAIILQKRELALQREQLELQREEMRESRLQLAEQARVQEGSRKAAIASLQIEVLKSEISAIEMESGAENFSRRPEYAAKIRAAADKMKNIIEDIEG